MTIHTKVASAGSPNSLSGRLSFVKSLYPRGGQGATLALAGSAAVYIALRVRSIWAPRLWSDELFNYSLSQGAWITLIKRAGLDMAHPPLFYLLLKLWIYLVHSSMAGLRTLTVAISIAALIPFLALGRQLHLRRSELAAALALLAVNNYLILYSYFLRPYSLYFLLSLCSLLAFIKFLKGGESENNRTLVSLIIVNVLCVYTHYFAWLTIAAELLWVAFIDRHRLRGFTFASAIVAICFLPWVGVIVYVSTQVPYTFLDQVSWFQPPDAQSIVLLLRSFNGGFNTSWLTLAGSAVFLSLIAVAIKNAALEARCIDPTKKHVNRPSLALLALLLAFPVAVSFAVSYWFSLIWTPRYVIASAAPYLLLVTAGVFRLRSKYARAGAIAFVLSWSVIAGSTDDLVDALHGPNAASYSLAQDLTRTEKRNAGPVRIYGLSPYAGQGLSLALSITGERRFETVACPVDVPLLDDYFWIAVTEHDRIAAERVRELAADPAYSLGEPIFSGAAPERHILIPVQRR